MNPFQPGNAVRFNAPGGKQGEIIAVYGVWCWVLFERNGGEPSHVHARKLIALH